MTIRASLRLSFHPCCFSLIRLLLSVCPRLPLRSPSSLSVRTSTQGAHPLPRPPSRRLAPRRGAPLAAVRRLRAPCAFTHLSPPPSLPPPLLHPSKPQKQLLRHPVWPRVRKRPSGLCACSRLSFRSSPPEQLVPALCARAGPAGRGYMHSSARENTESFPLIACCLALARLALLRVPCLLSRFASVQP